MSEFINKMLYSQIGDRNLWRCFTPPNQS